MSLFWGLSIYGAASPFVTSEGDSWLLMCKLHGFSNPAFPCLSPCYLLAKGGSLQHVEIRLSAFKESLSPAYTGHSGPSPMCFPTNLGCLKVKY